MLPEVLGRPRSPTAGAANRPHLAGAGVIKQLHTGWELWQSCQVAGTDQFLEVLGVAILDGVELPDRRLNLDQINNLGRVLTGLADGAQIVHRRADGVAGLGLSLVRVWA